MEHKKFKDKIMEHKKFKDIERFKPAFLDGFSTDDDIVIQEKIDGANCAIRYDAETNTVVAQSRKNILNTSNNLRGFYEWTQMLDVERVKEVLGENIILFGEWLVPHSVVYPKERYNKAYFYDAYDTNKGEYLPQSKVQEFVLALGVNYVPVMYAGKFKSIEHCMSYVGQTDFGGEYGEGIVVKCQSRLSEMDSKKPPYFKIVGEKFTETHAHKTHIVDTDKIAQMERDKEIVSTVVTEARVTKILHKFVDEGILPEDWAVKDMATIARNLGKAIFADCVKEEKDVVVQVTEFGKVANKVAMDIAKRIAMER